ncbi:hypothetical protein D3C71_1076580 [compost metagenome]
MQQGALQAVQDEAFDFPAQPHGLLPDGRHDVAGALQRLRAGPRRGAKLHDGNQIRRVDGMRDQAAVASRQMVGELAGGDAGRGTADDGVRLSHRIQRREQRTLDLKLFGRIFLDVARALDGIGQAVGNVDAADDGVGVRQQTLSFQLAQLLQDQRAGFGQHGCVDVVQAHLPALAGEHDGPALADQARSDNGGGVGSRLDCGIGAHQ